MPLRGGIVRRRWAPQWSAVIGRLPGSDSRGDVQLLIGDLNATLDHEGLRALLARGYLDAADSVGTGLTWTWPALGHPHTLPITIDHTDRRALIARLRLPRG